MRGFFTLLALLLAGPALAEAPDQYEATAAITLDGPGPYYRVTLPIEAMLAARSPDLADLRIFNGAGETVPFGLLRMPPETEEALSRTSVPWFPLIADEDDIVPPTVEVERRSDGTVVSVRAAPPATGKTIVRRGYLIDLSGVKDKPRRLELDWDAAATGLQELSVEASDDLQRWRSWAPAAELARLDFNGQHIERREIALPGETAHYLRLTWRSPRNAPDLTAAILVAGQVTEKPAAFVWSAPTAGTSGGERIYEWHWPHPVRPAALRVALPQTNALAPATLARRDDSEPGQPWQPMAQTTLYRLAIDGHETSQPDITVAALAFTSLRLTLDARGGGIGSGAPSLSLGLPAETVLFLARGDGPFRLAIGSSTAKSADLAPSALIPGWGAAAAPTPSTASLGAFEEHAAATPDAQPFGWQRLVLWAVLIAGIGAVAAMAASLLRQVRR